MYQHRHSRLGRREGEVHTLRLAPRDVHSDCGGRMPVRDDVHRRQTAFLARRSPERGPRRGRDRHSRADVADARAPQSARSAHGIGLDERRIRGVRQRARDRLPSTTDPRSARHADSGTITRRSLRSGRGTAGQAGHRPGGATRTSRYRRMRSAARGVSESPPPAGHPASPQLPSGVLAERTSPPPPRPRNHGTRRAPGLRHPTVLTHLRHRDASRLRRAFRRRRHPLERRKTCRHTGRKKSRDIPDSVGYAPNCTSDIARCRECVAEGSATQDLPIWGRG